MCIIADPPTFIPMFKDSDPEHATFVAVREWVTKGPGKFVMGGTKYNSELAKISSVIPALLELERKGRIVRAKRMDVDDHEVAVRKIEPSQDFDDPHLVALVRATGCQLICVRDRRSHKFLVDKKFYRTSGLSRPSLYTRANHKKLLLKSSPAPCCR